MKLVAVVLTAGALAGCGPKPGPAVPAAGAGPLTVYVPCGMELPFMNLRDQFQAANPEIKTEVVLDNANILVKRVIEKGEKPDLIASPGTVEMERLTKASKVRAEDVHHFGRYDLVLFGPRANPGNVTTVKDLLKPEVSTIAIADPAENSVGRYTQQYLQKLGLWDELRKKMILTDAPITAYKHVAREKAQASFAYRSCPLKTAPEKLAYSKVRIIEAVPLDAYDPAVACMAVLTATPRRAAAEKFVAFLSSEAGKAILAKYDVPAVTELRLFVPCGMVAPFLGIKALYEARNPTVVLNVEFDRSDALTDRILKNQSVPDLHFSIGHVETEALVHSGHVEAGTPVAFGTFQLALAANVALAGTTVKQIEDLTKPEVKSIVLTPTETSSVGAYTRKALEKLGLWEKLQGKIVYQPTIKDCYKELSSGRADAGFAYIGCPIPADPAKAEYSKVKAVQVVPDELFGGAVTFASVLKNSAHPKEAAAFVEFLKTPEARAALQKVGLGPVAAKP